MGWSKRIGTGGYFESDEVVKSNRMRWSNRIG